MFGKSIFNMIHTNVVWVHLTLNHIKSTYNRQLYNLGHNEPKAEYREIY